MPWVAAPVTGLDCERSAYETGANLWLVLQRQRILVRFLGAVRGLREFAARDRTCDGVLRDAGHALHILPADCLRDTGARTRDRSANSGTSAGTQSSRGCRANAGRALGRHARSSHARAWYPRLGLAGCLANGPCSRPTGCSTGCPAGCPAGCNATVGRIAPVTRATRACPGFRSLAPPFRIGRHRELGGG